MAFLIYSDIASDLPINHNKKKVERTLRRIKNKLETFYNLSFNGFAENQVLNFHFELNYPKSIYNSYFIKNVDSVKIKSLRSSSYERILEYGKDYSFDHSLYNDDYIKSIILDKKSLKYCLEPPYYLEVIADYGGDSEVPEFLKDAIIDYLEDFTALDNQGWNVIKSDNIDGVSSTTYDTAISQNLKVTKNPFEYDEIKKAINIILQ